MSSLSIVIPAFNEARRLPDTLEALHQLYSSKGVLPFELREVLVVNDGSTDETREAALQAGAHLPGFQVLNLPENQGKGAAIRAGLARVSTEWVLVADADQSTPWTQLQRFGVAALQRKVPVLFAARTHVESRIQVKQSWIRGKMGKTFNLLVRGITGLPFEDTQCGFKLFHYPSIQPFLGKLQIDRFAWDVEFLMFAQRAGLPLEEVPVVWNHKEESRVHPIKDSLEMLFRLIQLRLRATWK